MCTCPTIIPNPYYANKAVNSRLVDTIHTHLRVPCGVCSECIHTKQMSIAQRLQMESINSYPFFATLTYNNAHLPLHVCSNGCALPYADISHLQKMFKRIRKDNLFGRPFKAVYCTELGSRRGRPHFHVLFFLPKRKSDYPDTPLNLEDRLYHVVFDQWKVNVSTSRKYPVYEPLFTYRSKWRDNKLYCNYDLHYVKPTVTNDGVSNVAFYVTKYMLKPSTRVKRLQQALRLNLPELEYQSVWRRIRPRFDGSLFVGLGPGAVRSPFGDIEIDPDIYNYIDSCLDQSDEFPMYFNPVDGKPMPLSRYYKKKAELFPASRALDFHNASANSISKEKDKASKDYHFSKVVSPASDTYVDDLLAEFEESDSEFVSFGLDVPDEDDFVEKRFALYEDFEENSIFAEDLTL